MIFKTVSTKKYEGEENEKGLNLVIRTPVSIAIFGVIGLVIGCLLSAYCYTDYINGNETASIGIALGFLIIPGVTGILLILFSCRLITVKGEDLVFRDFLLRRHCYRLEDITRVIWSVDGYVFMGKSGKLFKIYDYSVSCERLFLELEKRGVELDVPGRSFGSGRSAAIHPCPDKRRFTVRSCNCSIPYGGKIKIEGGNLVFYRRFRKELRCTVRELTEVRIKENKEGRIIIKIFNNNHRLLFKISGSAGDCQDTHFVFALLRHLKESGVPLKGMEKVGEIVKCMMTNRFVNQEEAMMVFKEDYERILPVIRKYETILAASGFELMYGAIDRAEMENQLKGLFPDQMVAPVFVYGYYFCLTREGRKVYDKKQKLPLYHCSTVMTRQPQNVTGANTYEEDLKDLIYFEPIPEPAIRFILEYFHMLVKKKKIYLSENQLAFHDLWK